MPKGNSGEGIREIWGTGLKSPQILGMDKQKELQNFTFTFYIQFGLT